VRPAPVRLDDHALIAPEDVGLDPLVAYPEPGVGLPRREAARMEEAMEADLQRRADPSGDAEVGEQTTERRRALAPGVAAEGVA
jgi:hypothetical protein